MIRPLSTPSGRKFGENIQQLTAHRSVSDSDQFRLARVLYYIGLTLVAAVAVRPIPAVDLSDCVFFVSLAVAAGTAALTGATVKLPLPGLFVFGFLVFCVGAMFSLPVALHPGDAAGALVRFAYTTIVWFALGAIVLRSRRQIEVAIAAWIVSVGVSGLAAIVQVLWGAAVFTSITTIPTSAASGLPVAFSGRQIGLSLHPNDLGGAAAIVMAPAILFATSRIWTNGKTLVFTGLLFLVVACVALSGSVTAFGAAGAGTAIWVASSRVGVRRLIAIVAVLVLAGLSLTVINEAGSSSVVAPLDRISQTIGLTTATAATGLQRIDLDAVAWEEVLRNPLYGVGIDSVSGAEALGGIQVHNMFLLAWVGGGIFGILGLLIMIASLGASYLSLYSQTTQLEERPLVLSLAISFVSFLIVTLAQPVLFIRYGWVPAALVMPLIALRQRRDADAPRESTGHESDAAPALEDWKKLR
jgi:O-antigen ligase